METKEMLEWLRGFATGLRDKGDAPYAETMFRLADHLEGLEADRDHLLKIAKKMHLWIFEHTCDEYAAYKECGLTDEDDARLGYGGQFVIGGKGNT